MASSSEVRFDGWTLNTATGDLVKGDTRVRLQTQPLKILEELLAHPGELVTREQLISRLWPKGVIDFDTALNSAVRRLRTALKDSAETPRYIETIPRRGYRFVGRLDVLPGAPMPASQALPGGATGSVRAGIGRRRKVAAGLLVFALGLIALISLISTHPRPDARPPPEPGEGAQEHFQRAEHFFQRRAPGDIQLAQKYFLLAIESEPGFAPAWAGLAATYWIDTAEGRLPPEQGLARLRDAAERALSLDPSLAEAHLRLANYRWMTGDFDAYEAHLRKAIELEPQNPLMLSFSASEAAHQGDFDTAVALQQRAVEADPLSITRRYNLVAILYQAGRLGEAKAELLEARELSPNPERFSELLGLLLVLEGRYEDALQLESECSNEMIRQQILALAYHGLGRTAEADAALRWLVEAARGEDRLLVAEVYAWRGKTDAAFEWLHAASASEAGSTPSTGSSRHTVATMRYSPLLRGLHSDLRWDLWVQGAGQRSPEAPTSQPR